MFPQKKDPHWICRFFRAAPIWAFAACSTLVSAPSLTFRTFLSLDINSNTIWFFEGLKKMKGSKYIKICCCQMAKNSYFKLRNLAFRMTQKSDCWQAAIICAGIFIFLLFIDFEDTWSVQSGISFVGCFGICANGRLEEGFMWARKRVWSIYPFDVLPTSMVRHAAYEWSFNCSQRLGCPQLSVDRNGNCQNLRFRHVWSSG